MESLIGYDDISVVLPLIVLFFFSLIPITLKVLNKNKEISANAIFLQGMVSLVVTVVFVMFQFSLEPKQAFAGSVAMNNTTHFINVIILFTALLSYIFSFRHPAISPNQFSEQTFLLFNAAIGMMLLNISNDLVISFIGIELLSLPLYVLIGLGGDHKLTKEASFKYFILGSFASAFLLYGIAFLYGATGTTQISIILNDFKTVDSTYFTLGLMIFLVGLLFKIALAPFHAWLPDVYHGSPTPVTVFMATAVKTVIFAFIIKMIPFGKIYPTQHLLPALEWLAVLTMFIGSLAALKQTYLKRLIAYSSVAHTGYLFIGIIAALKGDVQQGAFGVLSYLSVYIFMTAGAFGFVSLFESKEDTRLTVDDLKGLAHKYPFVSFCFAVFMLSLAGIPPLGGFFAKLFLFSSAINVELYWLAIWGVLSSVVSVYYYLKPVVNMYMYESEGEGKEILRSHSKVAVGICALVVLLIGFFSQPFIERIQSFLS